MKHSRITQYAEKVAAAYHQDAAAILGESRSQNVVRVRWMLWAILQDAGMSVKSIGEALGTDHSTILSAIRKLREEMGDTLFEETVRKLHVAVVDGIDKDNVTKQATTKVTSVAAEIVDIHTLMTTLDTGKLSRGDGAVFSVAMNRLAQLSADAEKILATKQSG
jgi:hypothetical protein